MKGRKYSDAVRRKHEDLKKYIRELKESGEAPRNERKKQKKKRKKKPKKKKSLLKMYSVRWKK